MSDILIIGQSFKTGASMPNELCFGTKRRAFNGNSAFQGVVFFVPYVYGSGAPSKWVAAHGAIAPTTDSLVTVRILEKGTGQTYHVLVPQQTAGHTTTEAEATAYWQGLANNCCGSSPAIPNQTIPDLLTYEAPCPVETVVRTESYPFYDLVPALANGQVYTLSGLVIESPNNQAAAGAFAPAPPDAGFTTVALALAWANTNWGTKYGNGAAGGWSLLNNNAQLKLKSDPAATVQVSVGQINISTKAAVV